MSLEMKEVLLWFLFFALFSCSESDTVEFDPGQPVIEADCSDVVRDASGRKYPGLEPPSYQYCGPGWGRKMCRFLGKYDGTKWTAAEANIEFSNFTNQSIFISFFNLDNFDLNGDGLKLGESIVGEVKWNILLKRDDVDVLRFAYQYYGDSEEIEYTVTYTCEVIDGLLNFSSTQGHDLIFHPA